MPIGCPRGSTGQPDRGGAAGAGRLAEHRKWGTGYSKQQSTRPQTLGYGLVDSPVGQLAWIVEKFWAWTDCDGHPENVLTRDELLDNVMVYWVTGTGGVVGPPVLGELQGLAGRAIASSCPPALRAFPGSCLSAAQLVRAGYNITHWTDMPRGGHFAAFEQPELFVDDVRTFFATVR